MTIRCFYRLATPALVGVTLLFLAACSQDQQPEGEGVPNGTVERLVISASLDAPDTRTTLSAPDDDHVYHVLWKAGDQISVNGVMSDAVIAEDEGKQAVTFTIEGPLTAPFRVLYPGTTTEDTIVLPDTQHDVAGSFDPAAAASYGTAYESADGYSAKLRNFCGVLRFALRGSATLSRIEINSLGDECLYGTFALIKGKGGYTGVFDGGSAGTLTYVFDTPLQLTPSVRYCYIPIPAQHYASGIEALVYQTDGAFMRLKFWGSGRDLTHSDLIEFETKNYAAGRTENLLEIASLTAEDGGEPTAAPPGITVATYNVMRFYSDERPAFMTIERDGVAGDYKDAVLEATGNALKFTDADLIGINEIDKWSTSDGKYSLESMVAANVGMTGYSWELNFPSHISYDESWPISYLTNWLDDADPDFSTNYSYSCGFAYRTNVLTLEASGRVWLRCSNDNDKGYTVPDYHVDPKNAYGGCGRPARTCVWARFTHKASQQQFYFFVTHLPTKGQVADDDPDEPGYTNEYFACLDACVLSLNRLVEVRLSELDLPCILVGDMNRCETKDDGCYATLMSTGWNDAFNTVRAAGNLAPLYWDYDKSKARYSGTMSGSTWNDSELIENLYPTFRYDQIHTRNGSSQNITARTYRTVRNAYYRADRNGDAETELDIVYPSDHLPVVSYITFD